MSDIPVQFVHSGSLNGGSNHTWRDERICTEATVGPSRCMMNACGECRHCLRYPYQLHDRRWKVGKPTRRRIRMAKGFDRCGWTDELAMVPKATGCTALCKASQQQVTPQFIFQGNNICSLRSMQYTSHDGSYILSDARKLLPYHRAG